MSLDIFISAIYKIFQGFKRIAVESQPYILGLMPVGMCMLLCVCTCLFECAFVFLHQRVCILALIGDIGGF